MPCLSDDEHRELGGRALRMAYNDCESLMGCFVGLRFGAAGFDDELVRIATEGLEACRPILELLERMQAHLGLPPSPPDLDASDTP